jgi:TetR/AcrR family transcriptional regulator, transcriptional repressor for nem operon
VGRPKAFDEQTAVHAAMDLLWERGYRATTPAELGEALGIGRGSLYHAFGSKHALYRRALEQYVADQRRQFMEAFDAEGSMSERTRRALSVVLDGSAQPRGCMITTAAIEAPPDDETTMVFARAVLTEQRMLLRAAIEDGRRTGDLPTGPDTPDAGQAADAIIALLNGVRVMQRVGAAPPSLVDMAMRLL